MGQITSGVVHDDETSLGSAEMSLVITRGLPPWLSTSASVTSLGSSHQISIGAETRRNISSDVRYSVERSPLVNIF
jgi:hypothetical protein